MHSKTERIVSSSTKVDTDNVTMRPRSAKRPKIHPVSTTELDLLPRMSVISSSEESIQLIKYMIMMKNGKNNVSNDDMLFQEKQIKYNSKMSVEGVVVDIIKQNLGIEERNIFHQMKIGLILDNEILDNHQMSISSLKNVSTSVLFILIIHSDKELTQSTTRESTASLYEPIISSSTNRSFPNLNYLLISYNKDEQSLSTYHDRSKDRFIILTKVQPRWSFREILDEIHKMIGIGKEGYDLYYNNKCLTTTTNISMTLNDFREEQKMNDKQQAILSFVLRRKISPSPNIVLTKNEKNEENAFNAFLLFIQLMMANIIFNQKYAERWERFFRWCDKDKSNSLERKEVDIGLLTILNLLTKSENHQSFSSREPSYLSFSAYHLLPTQNLPTQNWTIEQFKSLFLDTLVEHVKYNHIINRNLSNPGKMKSVFDYIDGYYLKSLEITIKNKMFIPKPNEWKSIAWGSIIKLIAPFLLSLLFWPVFVYSIMESQFTETEQPADKGNFCSTCCKKAISVFVALLSCGLYGTYYYLYLYYQYLNEMNSWNVTFLEIYWPLALHMYCMLLIWLYIYHDYVSPTEIYKQSLVEHCYEDARFDFNEKNAIPIQMTTKTTPIDIRDLSYVCNKSYTSKELRWYLIGIAALIAAAIIHQHIPSWIRPRMFKHNSNSSTSFNYTVVPKKVGDIQKMYKTLGSGYSFVFFLMIFFALKAYISLHIQVSAIMTSVTNDEQFIEHNSDFYYDLRKPINLDYFLARFKKVIAETDTYGYYIYTLTYAFLIDVTFIIIEIVRLFFVSFSFAPLDILLIIEILLLSICIIAFLIIVALSNQKMTTDAQQLVKRTITETTAKLIDFRSIRERKTSEDPSPQDFLEDSIEYLSAMSVYIEDEKKNYSVKLFHFLVIDMNLVWKVGGSLLLGLLTSIFSFVKSKSLFA